MLVLPAEALERLRALARAAAPAECCGLLIGRDTADGRIVDALDPVINDERTRYGVPAAHFRAAEQQARRQGRYVCGVFHSHPAGAARPSRMDVECGWPGLDYVIVGAHGDVRAWRLREDRESFGAVTIRMASP